MAGNGEGKKETKTAESGTTIKKEKIKPKTPAKKRHHADATTNSDHPNGKHKKEKPKTPGSQRKRAELKRNHQP